MSTLHTVQDGTTYDTQVWALAVVRVVLPVFSAGPFGEVATYTATHKATHRDKVLSPRALSIRKRAGIADD